jgi:DNA polymerase I-like protein with 3'-5' exonuclease and polymerase domains
MAPIPVVSDLKPCIPSELHPPLNITLVTDESGLEKIQGFFSRKSVFVLDTETNIVDNFYFRRIRTIQIGDKDEQYIIDLLPFAERYGLNLMDSLGNYRPHIAYQKIIDTLRPALETKTHLKIGHNLQFDYEVMKFNLGLHMWNLYDTMVAEKVIRAGEWNYKLRGIWTLDDCVARYAGLKISKEKQKSFDLVTPLDQDQIDYCALDCRVPFAVKNGQRRLLEQGNLFYAAQLEFDAIPAFGDLHLNGMRIDSNLWRPLVEEVEGKHKKILAKLDSIFIPIVGKKLMPEHDLVALENAWRNTTDKAPRAEARQLFMQSRRELKDAKDNWESYEGEAAVNYSSQPQLLAALRKLGYGPGKLKTTDDRDLKKAAEHPKWAVQKVFDKGEDPTLEKVGTIDVIRLFRETGKFLSTYGHEWYLTYGDDGHVNPYTGRIHSEIKQQGAETGRTSSVKPNIQNLPKGKQWRGCFIADPGHKIITLDYNGCELRILTEYSREKVWLDAFLNGWDVHSVGAEIIFGDEWKNAAEEGCAYYRDHQKCECKEHKALRDAVKSINFGIAYGMEARKLAEQIGKDEEYAIKLLDRYKKAFPTLVKYLEISAKTATAKMESRTLSQRRRKFSKPEWKTAVELTIKDWKEKGKKDLPQAKHFNQKYKSMYAAIEREGKNTPIQGSNADIAKIAMGCGFGKDGLPFMWHGLGQFNARLINFVHDEFVIDVPEDRAKACFDFVAGCMSRAGAELVKSIPMTTEGHIEDRWTK